mgnify:CR=1 FL=1
MTVLQYSTKKMFKGGKLARILISICSRFQIYYYLADDSIEVREESWTIKKRIKYKKSMTRIAHKYVGKEICAKVYQFWII